MCSSKSDSISQDVEHERKSKWKQDQISDGRASSESEDDTSLDEQEENGEDGSGSESYSSGEDDVSLEEQKGQPTLQDNDTRKTTESLIYKRDWYLISTRHERTNWWKYNLAVMWR